MPYTVPSSKYCKGLCYMAGAVPVLPMSFRRLYYLCAPVSPPVSVYLLWSSALRSLEPTLPLYMERPELLSTVHSLQEHLFTSGWQEWKVHCSAEILCRTERDLPRDTFPDKLFWHPPFPPPHPVSLVCFSWKTLDSILVLKLSFFSGFLGNSPWKGYDGVDCWLCELHLEVKQKVVKFTFFSVKFISSTFSFKYSNLIYYIIVHWTA